MNEDTSCDGSFLNIMIRVNGWRILAVESFAMDPFVDQRQQIMGIDSKRANGLDKASYESMSVFSSLMFE